MSTKDNHSSPLASNKAKRSHGLSTRRLFTPAKSTPAAVLSSNAVVNETRVSLPPARTDIVIAGGGHEEDEGLFIGDKQSQVLTSGVYSSDVTEGKSSHLPPPLAASFVASSDSESNSAPLATTLKPPLKAVAIERLRRARLSATGGDSGGSASEGTKRRRKLIRDSLASRNSIGRPGSRRYQRWINTAVLYDTDEDADIPPEQRAFDVVPTPNANSILARLTAPPDSDDDLETLPSVDILKEQFRDVSVSEHSAALADAVQSSARTRARRSRHAARRATYHGRGDVDDEGAGSGWESDVPGASHEQRLEHLAKRAARHATMKDVDPYCEASPLEGLYSRVPRRLRAVLIRQASHPLLKDLEGEVVSLLIRAADSAPETVKPLSLVIPNRFHRLLAHALAAFYGLKSASHDSSRGQGRVTRIFPPPAPSGLRLAPGPCTPASISAYLIARFANRTRDGGADRSRAAAVAAADPARSAWARGRAARRAALEKELASRPLADAYESDTNWVFVSHHGRQPTFVDLGTDDGHQTM